MALAVIVAGGLTLATLGGFSLGCGGGGGNSLIDESGETVDARGWIPFKSSGAVDAEKLDCDEAALTCGCVEVKPKGGTAEDAYAVRARVEGDTILVKAAIPYCAEFEVTFCDAVAGTEVTYEKRARSNPSDATGDCTSDVLAVSQLFNADAGVGVAPIGAAYLISGDLMKTEVDSAGSAKWSMGMTELSGPSLAKKHIFENDVDGSLLILGKVIPPLDRTGNASVALGRVSPAPSGDIADIDNELLFWLSDPNDPLLGVNLTGMYQSGKPAVSDGIIIRGGVDRVDGLPPLAVPVGDITGDGLSDTLTLGYNLLPLMDAFIDPAGGAFDLAGVTQTAKLYTAGFLAGALSLASPEGESEIWINAAGIGDVNNDGVSDFAVTALTIVAPPIGDDYTPTMLGTKVRLFLGVECSTAACTAEELAELANPDAVMTGGSFVDGFGFSIRGGMDINGDGATDLAIGAPAGFVSLAMTMLPTIAIDGLTGLQNMMDYFENGFIKSAAMPNATVLEKVASMAKARSVDEMMQGKVYVFPGGAVFDKADITVDDATIAVLSDNIEGDAAEAEGLGHAMGQLVVTLDNLVSDALCWVPEDPPTEGYIKEGCSYKIGLEQMSRFPGTFGMSLALGDFMGSGLADIAVGSPTALTFKDPNLVGQMVSFIADTLIKDLRDAGGFSMQNLIEVVLPDVIDEVNKAVTSVGKVYVFNSKAGMPAAIGAADADLEILGTDASGSAWGFGSWMQGGMGFDFTNDGFDDFAVGGFSLKVGSYPGYSTMVLLDQKTGYFFGGLSLASQDSMGKAPVLIGRDLTPMVIMIYDRLVP